MWPRTKRGTNEVEARGFVKDGGRAVLGLPKEPQHKKIAENEVRYEREEARGKKNT